MAAPHDRSRLAVASERDEAVAEELEHRLRQQALLGEYGLFALRKHSLTDLLQEATRLCAEGLGTRFCKVMEFLPEEDQLIVRAGVGWKPGVVGTGRAGADLGSPAGYTFRTGEPVIANDLARETRFRMPRILADHGIKGAINVIVRGEGEPFGVLEVDSPTTDRFIAADIAFMQGFANLLGVAIERHKSETALRAARERTDEILESISDAFYAVDRDWRFTYVNRKAEEWWGRRREDLIGKRFQDEFPQAVGGKPYAALRTAMQERRPVHLEALSPVLDRWLETHIHPTSTGGLSVYFRDIGARKRAEEQRTVLTTELEHRVKNTLAMVQAIATQTMRNAGSLAEARDAFAARLATLAQAHDILIGASWPSADVATVVGATTRLHDDGTPGRFRITGPELRLAASAALGLALILHELSTNAAKYGALSTASGHVEIAWSIEAEAEGERFILRWTEAGGPPVTAPTRKGFGTRLIERGLPGSVEPRVDIDYRPEGLACRLEARLADVQEPPS